MCILSCCVYENKYILIYVYSRQIILALNQRELSASDEMEMVRQVKDEVKKLSTKQSISKHITLNEQEAKRIKDKQDMIAYPQPKTEVRKMTFQNPTILQT